MEQVTDLVNLYQIKKIFSTLLFVTFLVWYLQYHWKRRRLYRAAWKRPGPFPLPFIGSALYFVEPTEGEYNLLLVPKFTINTVDILKNALSLIDLYKSPIPVWISTKLFFVVFEAKDLEVIMNSPHALKKGEWLKFAEPVLGTGLFTAPVDKWKRHRKIIMPTFNKKILENFVPIFAEQSKVLVHQLQKEVGKGEFDVFDYVGRCTLDMVCETAMGTSVGAQTSDSDYVKWSNKALEISYKRMVSIWYHPDFVFGLTRQSKELRDVTTKMYSFTENVIRQKRKSYKEKFKQQKEFTDKAHTNRKTFLELLIELSEDGAKLTDEDLREEVITFTVAGSDTTASVNSFTFMMLGMHPDIQEKVYREVLDVLGPDRTVESADLNKFLYLDRVLRETMRLFPLGASMVRDIAQDIKLEKCTVPGGSSVVMVIIAMHRDPNVYPNPFKFEPDRFLPEEVAKRHPYSWLPFSGGPRNCIGLMYAFMAMKTLVATVVRKYKFSCKYRRIEDIRLKVDLLLKPVDGFKVSLQLRN